MTLSSVKQPPTLAWLVSLRIMIAAGLALLIQTFVCLAENYGDDRYYARWFINLETNRIYDALHRVDDRVRLASATSMSHYRGQHAASYAFRVRDQSGNAIAASNAALMRDASPPAAASAALPDAWQRQLSDGKWFHIAGGKKFTIDSKPVWIEVATLGDPAAQRYYALWMDMVEDVLIPVLPTILLLAALAILSVRGAVRPLENASLLAEQIEASAINERFQPNGMPREAASFCSAINRLLERVSTLISSQKLFISRAAHELRTPLGIMLLELGRIPDPRARRLESDVDLMTRTLNRMLGLARMDVVDQTELDTISLGRMSAEIVKQLAPLAEHHDCELSLRHDSPGEFEGDLASMREAVLNLIENAVKHSHRGARVMVTCGPQARLTVEDDGPGLPEAGRESLFEPFYRGPTKAEGSGLGLAIVKRAVELHGGSIDVGKSSLGGTRISLQFPDKT